MQNLKNIKGFTLVELSISLVIIALLVGGVLAGQDILTATKRNAIITEVNTFRTAIANFRTKYFNNLPGDFDEAEKFWTSSLTTDGDGDGKIDKTQSTPGESLLVWQHLNLAEMLPGNYTGAMDASDLIVPNENVPGSDYHKDIGYQAMYSTGLQDMLSSHSAYNRNIILAAGCSVQDPDNNEFCGGGILVPADAHSIDRKIDDGVAYSGTLISYNELVESSGCSFSLDEILIDYDLDSTVKGCMLVFNYAEFN